MAKRPLGVTAICIAGAAWAAITLMAGIGMMVAMSMAQAGIIKVPGYPLPEYAQLIADFMAAAFILSGAISLLASFWLYKMKKRGWMLFMAIQAIAVLLGIITFRFDVLDITLSFAMPAAMMGYLWYARKLFK